MAETLKIFVAFFVLGNVGGIPTSKSPPYIKQCRSDAKDLSKCFLSAMHHIRPYLAKGIPEINVASTEPLRVDELSLSLTTGPNGYKVTLRDVDVFGVGNFSATSLKLASGRKPFETRIFMPKLRIASKYSSSGILIVLPASGNGTFHANLADVVILCRGKATVQNREGIDYLHIDSMDLTMDVKSVRMMVKKVHNTNKILTEATNLFLKENGLEVLKAMNPQLQKKLATIFMRIVNQVLDNTPLAYMYHQV